jgi:hypothetical protein
VVDTTKNTVTVPISHFSVYAILCFEAPEPAVFELGSLIISPAEIYAGETLDISVLVTNTGGVAGNHQVMLKIDGLVESIEEFALDAGASKVVDFAIGELKAGSHVVDVNGLSASILVREPANMVSEPPVPPIKDGGAVPATAVAEELTPADDTPTYSWAVLAEIISIAVIAIALTALILLKRRSRLVRESRN